MPESNPLQVPRANAPSVHANNHTVDELIELLMDDTYNDLYPDNPNRLLSENEVTAFTIFIRAARGAIMENHQSRDANNNVGNIVNNN